MHSPYPALLVGPYDWQPDLLPQSLFDARIKALRAAADGVDAILVHGDRLDDAGLGYLTGFVPKLGPALALLPADAPPRLLFSGGGGMGESAKLLTWIADVRALGNPAPALAALLAPLGAARIGLVGGAGMTRRLYATLRAALPDGATLVDLDPALAALRRHKAPAERHLLHAANAMLARALAAFAGATGDLAASGLAAERAAYAAGAQDVRVLAGDAAHPPLPIDHQAGPRPQRLRAQIGVRHAGYWVQGWLTLGADTGPAEAALAALLPAMRPGVRLADLSVPGKFRVSSSGVGLAPCEAPADEPLAVGDVVVLRLDAADAGVSVSAVVAVGDGGAERL